MILPGFAYDVFNFSIVIQWWLIFQEHIDWVHPIVFLLLIWLLNYHQILLDCFIGYFCRLDQRLRSFLNNDIRQSWCSRGSNPC
jgi:hypothetical protein